MDHDERPLPEPPRHNGDHDRQIERRFDRKTREGIQFGRQAIRAWCGKVDHRDGDGSTTAQPVFGPREDSPLPTDLTDLAIGQREVPCLSG
ncbi:hypothetical protein GCM10010443_42060 [Actinoplanes cyaneus]